MAEYVGLLRGVNVGGHQVRMAKLRKTLERAGFRKVTTILASGNVVFEAEKERLSSLTVKLEAILSSAFGFSIPVLLRTRSDIEKLIESDPFRGIEVTPETRLYVTFLAEKPKGPDSSNLGKNNFKILSATNLAICTVHRSSPDFGTVDLMSVLTRQFGRKITTRNWNTIVKIARVFP